MLCSVFIICFILFLHRKLVFNLTSCFGLLITSKDLNVKRESSSFFFECSDLKLQANAHIHDIIRCVLSFFFSVNDEVF